MNALSIGIDARPLGFPNTGIGRYTHEIIERISTSGHRLHLYTTEANTPTYANSAVRCQSTRQKRFTSTLVARRLFPKWAREDDIDLFWSPRHHLPANLNCASVVTIHDLVWQKAPETMRPLGRWVDGVLMSSAVAQADRIIAVSQSTARDLIEWRSELRGKISIIHEAAAVRRNPLGSNQLKLPQRFFLFVGTFEPRKNISRLISALSSIAPEVPHHLILAGGRGWGTRVDEQIAGLGPISDRILTMRPTDSEMQELYRHCEALVLPSLYEGFGLPIVEAMSFGKPIITSNNSSLPEIAGKSALYVDPLSTQDVANAMLRIANDSKLRRQLSEAATIQSRNFSWDKAAKETLEVFLDAASHSF